MGPGCVADKPVGCTHVELTLSACQAASRDFDKMRNAGGLHTPDRVPAGAQDGLEEGWHGGRRRSDDGPHIERVIESRVAIAKAKEQRGVERESLQRRTDRWQPRGVDDIRNGELGSHPHQVGPSRAGTRKDATGLIGNRRENHPQFGIRL